MFETMLNYPNSLFGQFERMRRDLDEIFGAPALASSIRSVSPGTLPAINVGHTTTSVEVYAFAPGLDPAKTEITLDRGVLRITGERRDLQAGEGKAQVYTRERSTGAFTRTVALSDDVDPDRVKASYRDGVLQVSIARRESAQPKRITVQ